MDELRLSEYLGSLQRTKRRIDDCTSSQAKSDFLHMLQLAGSAVSFYRMLAEVFGRAPTVSNSDLGAAVRAWYAKNL